MKTSIKTLVISGFVIATLAFTTSCEKDMMNSGKSQYAAVLDVSADGTSTVIGANMQSAFIETSGITDSELNLLIKMKEEEKLARDVYAELYEKWGSTVFLRISAAENNHLNAVIRLLQYYGSADTLTGETGTFTNNEVQTLYSNLVANGSVSIGEAYKAGALIEEMDINDLNVALAATSNANIIMVFENLERGSRNHLRSFYNQLTTQGIVYTPVYITQSEYEKIVTSAMEKGNRYKMKGKGNGNGSCDGSGNAQGKMKGKR